MEEIRIVCSGAPRRQGFSCQQRQDVVGMVLAVNIFSWRVAFVGELIQSSANRS